MYVYFTQLVWSRFYVNTIANYEEYNNSNFLFVFYIFM